MPRRPAIKTFGLLTAADFAKNPVWMHVHSFDYDEAWYDDCDEEDFRVFKGDLPADPSDGMYLVAATGTLADGSTFPGFLTPANESSPALIQPYLFAQGERVGFWGGMFGIPPEKQAKTLSLLGKTAPEVFPLHVAAKDGLAEGVAAITVDAFLSSQKEAKPTAVATARKGFFARLLGR